MTTTPLPPDALSNPLSEAVTQRDRTTLQMVERAVAQKKVRLAYQPIVQASRPEHISFYEGFIRVLDDTGRVIPARDFIEVAERKEIGRVLDCLALEMGLDALRQNPDLRLAINMSARSIGYQRWKDTLLGGCARDATLGERLVLEITESSVMLMPDLVAVFIMEMQHKGISFALDDFGAGYSAFRHLRDCHFDMLKIDGTFVRGIAQNPDNQMLARAMISVANHFDMFTISESVENIEDARFMKSIGIDCFQGYLFGAASLQPSWAQNVA